jgi:short-subunit dehydrogenase
MAPTPPDTGRRSASQLWNRARFGPCAVVTGASSGIGRAFAIELAARGFDLVLVGRRKEALDELAASLTHSHGIKASTLAIDLGHPESSEAVLRAVSDRDVGLLVCSAGFGSSGAFIDGTLADECAMVDVNCRALMALTWHFARKFAEQRRGGIVLMSSLVGFQGVPGAANYAATKAYVQALAEGLHHELRPLGVSVIACAPGPIHSGFAERATMKMGMAQRPEVIPASTLDALGKKLTVRPGWLAKALEWSLKPLPRWGRVRMMGVVMAGMAQPVARPARNS